MEAYLALPRRHQKFVDAFIDCGKGAEAVRRAKLSSKKHKWPQQIAWKLMQRPGIRQAIAERQQQAIEEAHITRVDTLMQLKRVEKLDPRRMCDEGGKILPFHKLPDDVALAMQGCDFEFDAQGNLKAFKPRFASRNEASRLLAQIQQFLVERHEVSGPNGGPIQTENVSTLTDEQLESIARGGSAAPTDPKAGKKTPD
jgi:phage terminase small subunit